MMTVAAILLGLISVVCTAHMAINWEEWPSWKRWTWIVVVFAMAYTTDQLAWTEEKWTGMLAALLAMYAAFFFIVIRAATWSAKVDADTHEMMKKHMREQRKLHHV